MAPEESTTETPSGRADDAPRCPACQHAEAYHLSDGRYKCKQCKKKFSTGKTRSRIPGETLKALIGKFWTMETAEQCANSLGINRKTAQSYYDRLRTHMARSNASALLGISGCPADPRRSSDGDKLPVFWSLLHCGQIHILFPENQTFSLERQDLPEVDGISEIYTNSPSAKDNTVLDKFYRRTLWARKETDEQQLGEFWRRAKLNLQHYRGGCKSRFPLFMEEMAFRFNHREREGVIRLLQSLLSESTTLNQTEESGR